MLFYNKGLVFYFLCFVLFTHTACEKSFISPPNQDVAFIKYYGHVSDQTAHDLKKTADGGYIILGSTNSFNEEVEHDVFVVKADQYGNEMWSTTLGRASTFNGSSSTYINFHEVGISLVILPDEAGYVIACNRTYVNYTTVNPAPPDYTKIVLYQLDIAGVNVLGPDGEELETNVTLPSILPQGGSTSSESVTDLKFEIEGGNLTYILTGNTNNISITKPDPYPDKRFDLTDLFTTKLDVAFQPVSGFTKTYGRNGSDFASSIHILDDAYLVIGTSENEWSASNFKFRLIAVKYSKSTGVPINVTYYGGESNSLDLACSVMDTNNNHTFIATSSIEANVNENIQNNKVVLYEIDTELNQIRTMEHSFGMNLSPQSIDVLGANQGFIVSFNHKRTDKEHDIAISRFDRNFSLASGWPVLYGYNNAASTFSTLEEAGSIIAENDPSTSITVSYSFVGTYGLSTNDMIGLTKVNVNGNFEPPE